MSEPVIDPDVFRQAMGRLATGVAVVSTLADGHDHAMTANAVTSVSLDPVLVLVCVEREARFHDAVVQAGVWGVSVLDASARGTAQWLASRGRPLPGQLDRVPHHRGERTGVALVDASLATLECRTVGVYPGGDHSIVVGEVVNIGIALDPGAALLYFRGMFGSAT